MSNIKYRSTHLKTPFRAGEKYGCAYYSSSQRDFAGQKDYGILLPVIQLLILLFILIGSITIFEKNGLFYVSDISISCQDIALKTEIKNDLFRIKGKHMLSISLEGLKEDILKNRRVDSVSISYSMFPLMLDIGIRERDFWAKTTDGESDLFIDKKGNICSLPGYERNDLIKVEVNTSSVSKRQEALKNIIMFHNCFDSNFHINRYQIGFLYTEAVGDKIKMIIPNISISPRFDDRLEKILQAIKKEGDYAGCIIDLRFKNMVVVRRNQSIYG